MFVFSNISLKCRSSSKTTSVLYVVKLVISSIPSGQTNGGEFISSAFKLWLSNRSIRFESSAPHTPEQKGVAERANRTIVEAGRSLLYAKHVPLELWGEAIACAVYSLNRVSNSKSTTTPHELWYGSRLRN